MADQQQNIKNIIRQEYVRCSQDPIHFMKKYCMVQHPTRGRISFNLYPFQEKVLKLWLKNNYSIINKSRQLGISTLAAGFSLWTMIFHKDKTILCIATKQTTAVNMVDKVQFMYQQLPSWLKGKDKPTSDNKLSLKLTNGSQIIASSAAGDAGRSYAVSLLLIDEAAFIEGIDRIYTSIKPTISTGGGCIALSSPNGVGNWFHKTWVSSLNSENDFIPIKLPWNVHPERDDVWFEREKQNMGPKEIAQEYECDFLASGNNVITNDIIEFYEKTYVIDPVERRGMGGDYWIFEYANPTETYVVCADVARGDGGDYSTFHVIATKEYRQVAEFKSKIGTREFARLLITAAAEYNNALLVIENANIGWDVINTVIENGYPNLYYSPKGTDMSIDNFVSRIDNNQTIPGITNSTRTRPLFISKLETALRERQFVLQSKRIIEELRTFIWDGGKAQAQNGYNDDLTMALSFGLYVRDTALIYHQNGIDITKATLNSFSISQPNTIGLSQDLASNSWKMLDAHGNNYDLSWLL
jgi:hypothetical protein